MPLDPIPNFTMTLRPETLPNDQAEIRRIAIGMVRAIDGADANDIAHALVEVALNIARELTTSPEEFLSTSFSLAQSMADAAHDMAPTIPRRTKN